MKRSNESKQKHSFSKTLAGVVKLFGAATVLSTLIPYRITTDEDTGEKKYRAIFWEATRVPQDEDGTEKSLSVHVGFFNPLADDEAHMYADDLAVDYTQDEYEAEPVAETEEESSAEEAGEETAEEPVETAEAETETTVVSEEESTEESVEAAEEETTEESTEE